MHMKTLGHLTGSGMPAVFLVLLSILAGGCGEEETTPIASPELLESGAQSVIYLMVMEITVNGIREGRVEADTAYLYPDSSLFSLRNPVLVLFDEQGIERARVISERGRFNSTTKELVARGEVVLTIREGDRQVETQELNYDPNGDRIWSDSTSVMREGGTVTRGESFRSDLDFRRAEVINGSIVRQGGATDPDPPGRGPSRS